LATDARFGAQRGAADNTAPAFTIDSFTDVSFSQTGGWALRASADIRSSMWAGCCVRWAVNASAANQETVTFTVHNLTAGALGF
jgi:hypothetical protein